MSATVQHYLAHLRPRQARMPVIQSTSRMNHRVERLWPEVNSRINYPVKRSLVDMEANQEITMHTNSEKFCISWTTINVIQPSMVNFIALSLDKQLNTLYS